MMQYDHQYSSSCITFIFLICLFSFASCQNTLRQGETLNTTSQLVSASRLFTLGFYTPNGANTSYIAIWYTDGVRGSLNTPVWIGNRNTPVSNNSFPNMTISSTGDLFITHGITENPINLYAGGESRQNVSATLLDSGNFVLRQATASGEVILWESFDYPTDTLLPGMRLGVNYRTGRVWSLTSWFRDITSDTTDPPDPATGPFTLDWDTALDRLVIRRRGDVYWTSGLMREPGNLRVYGFENMDEPDPLNSNYNFTHFTSSEEEYFMYTLLQVPNIIPDRTVVSAWRLDYQGDVRDSDRPAVAVASLCYGYNTGGSGPSRGCELWDQPSCRTPRQNFSLRSGYFIPVDRGQYVVNSNLSFSDCRQNCWNDCECGGFMAIGVGCQYWRGRNLRFVQSLDGSQNRIYVLVSGSSNNRSRTLMWTIIAVVVATLLLLSVAVIVFLRISKRRKREEDMIELLTLDGYTDAYEHEGGAKGHDLRMFAYASIVAATDNFSSKYKLGEGGFGSVYKGRTPEGHEIAVKILSRGSGQGLLEFKTELVLISKLQHVNLVKLVGFCVHGEDKMIVYDFMPNKSLDFYLFADLTKREELDWGRRFNIIEGIAQGILYLHKYSRLSIVHRDLKCSNILLDENLNPKISDFGLARIFKQNIDEANTNRRVGTYGYMAPEYAMQGIFSYKSDVYSYGVLVLEIVSGRKNSSFHSIEGPLNLVEYAWELWNKDSALELMDPTLSISCNVEQLQRCINIGLLCVENRATDRPNIEDVISMLKNETSLRVPKNPSFITRNMVVEELGKNSPIKFSVNELSISEVGGR